MTGTLRIPTDLPHEYDLCRLACVLNIETCEAVGVLVSFWCSVANSYPDGDISRCTDRDLQLMAGYWRQRTGRKMLFAMWVRENMIEDGKVKDWDMIFRSTRNRDGDLTPQETERRKMSASLRAMVMERDEFKCRRCGAGREHGPLVVDHIVPVIRGGKSTTKNLQTLCRDCNAGKGDRLPTPHDMESRV